MVEVGENYRGQKGSETLNYKIFLVTQSSLGTQIMKEFDIYTDSIEFLRYCYNFIVCCQNSTLNNPAEVFFSSRRFSLFFYEPS